MINELRARERQQATRDFTGNFHNNSKSVYSDGEVDAEAECYSTASNSAVATSPMSPRPSSSSFNPWTAGAGRHSGAEPYPHPQPHTTSSHPHPHPRLPRASASFTSAAFRPNSREYFHLIPQCVELYCQHVYPIMPLLYIPWLRAVTAQPIAAMTASEKNLIYSLCALTALHMSGKSLSSSAATATSATAATAPMPLGRGGTNAGIGTTNKATNGARVVAPQPQPSWDAVGRFFLDECLAVRKGYDFPEDTSLGAVVSSFWLSTSFFEINRDRKSWFYLREALTLALDLQLEDEASYRVDSNNLGSGSRGNMNGSDNEASGSSGNGNLNNAPASPEEALCRRRVFWILFVTERSFAILRRKPLALRRTPLLPQRGHAYEHPEIHSGFVKLVKSYMPLDESFVNAWNDGSDPGVTAATYLHLQRILAKPLDFLTTTRRSRPARPRGAASAAMDRSASGGSSSGSLHLRNGGSGNADGVAGHVVEEVGNNEDEQETEIEPTAIQKADLLMTQQWLRLIVWQSSCGQGLLSTAAEDESMTFGFPLSIARDTVAVLQSLPSQAIEVHGMGIFEKIFEIAYSCVSVLGFSDSHHQQQHYHHPDQPYSSPRGFERGSTSWKGTGESGSSYGGPLHPQPQPSRGMATATAATRFPIGRGASSFGGMDHLRGDLSLLTQGGRSGVHTDPVEFFVRMLSASPNSRTRFAEKLLMFAGESPGSFRTALSPAPSSPTSTSTASSSGGFRAGGMATGGVRPEAVEVDAEMVDGLATEVIDHENENGNDNENDNENVFVLKQEFPGGDGDMGGMAGVRGVPKWVQATAVPPALPLNTHLGGMTASACSGAPPVSASATTPASASGFSQYMAVSGDGHYGFGTSPPAPAPAPVMPPHDFVARVGMGVGPGPWPGPIDGAFLGEMPMAAGLAHEGMTSGDELVGLANETNHHQHNNNTNNNVPRSQPGGYITNGMLGGVW